jgi:hypothetical protein
MNIKSLLLGSAAAFVAVSGARAADAVVIAEPEPMEYVRICDTYGVGYYYIPGTETCLKVSGYARYDIGVGILGIQDALDRSSVFDGTPGFDTDDTYFKRARFALRVDARSETELGTLRAYTQLNFQWDTVDVSGSSNFAIVDAVNGFSVNHAYIELGGFRVGKTDSLFSTFTGYSSGVINDGLVPYGPFDTHQIAYTFTGGNGFTAAVALEEGDGSWDSDVYDNTYSLDSYVPHVVGGVGYAADWGGVSVVAGYDSVWEEGAVKGRVDFNASDALSLFVMAAWGSVDDNFAGPGGRDGDSPNYYAPWGGEWAAWVGGAWKFNEKATFNFEVGYDDLEDFSVAANVDYQLVPNLTITPEIVYVDNFGEDDFGDNWGGYLRFQANFGG